nr:MAG TPA: hypothetical protein [Caudoviricetes sp.]
MAVQTPTTTPCANGAPFSSLRFCAGQRVIPGIRTAVYYTAKENITAWPTLPHPAPALRQGRDTGQARHLRRQLHAQGRQKVAAH